MIKHIVMWTFKASAEGRSKAENMKRFKEMLETLPDLIKEIRFFEVGMNMNPSDAAMDMVLISEFEDREALQRYQAHPRHVTVKDFVSQIKETGVVVDYEC